MSRFIQQFTTPFDHNQVMNYVNSYMQQEGFEYITDTTESYWKKGVGLMTAPQYLKVYEVEGGYVLEAWLKFAVLPGVYCGEMGIEGFMGAIPKGLLRGRVDNIFAALKANLVQQNNGYNAPQQNAPQNNQYGYNVPPHQNAPQNNQYGYNVPPHQNAPQNNQYGYNVPPHQSAPQNNQYGYNAPQNNPYYYNNQK